MIKQPKLERVAVSTGHFTGAGIRYRRFTLGVSIARGDYEANRTRRSNRAIHPLSYFRDIGDVRIGEARGRILKARKVVAVVGAVAALTAIPGGTADAHRKGKHCTPGYSKCLHPASDYDCMGGSGNGPRYTGITRVTGSDPYGLDSDNDGWGCE